MKGAAIATVLACGFMTVGLAAEGEDAAGAKKPDKPESGQAKREKTKLKWKSFRVQYMHAGRVRKNTVRLSDSIDTNTPIRGICSHRLSGRGDFTLDAFAHRNHFALFDRFDGRHPEQWPVQAMLDAAAEATGHKELKHARAVVTGLSNVGRRAARWARGNRDRVLAVILDHSWAPRKPTSGDSLMDLQVVPGIPMFFNSSYSDTYQDHDRRALHYSWCRSAYRESQQPCTSVIHHEGSGNVHNQAGSRDLQAVWLEEVLAQRLPDTIPMDGSPYTLKDADVFKGYTVVAKLVYEHPKAKDRRKRGRSWHTAVEILPASEENNQKGSWWLPGPRSAKMYVDWVKRNGGTVKTDPFPE